MTTRGRYESDRIDLTSSGVTQARMVATANTLTYSGTTGSNDIKLTGVLAPTADNDAVNKGYLDTFLIGLYGYDSTGGQSATSTTPTGLIFNNSVIADTGLSLNTGTGVITFTDAGRYQVSFWAQFESVSNTGSAESTLSARIDTDPAGGTAWATKAGSLCTTQYTKNNTLGYLAYGCGKTIIIDVVAGETLRVAFFRGTGTTSAQTRANESSISITRIQS